MMRLLQRLQETENVFASEVAAFAAGAPVEHGALDLVPAGRDGSLELGDEDAEIGVVRPGVHLRHEQDPHGASKLDASGTVPSLTRTAFAVRVASGRRPGEPNYRTLAEQAGRPS